MLLMPRDVQTTPHVPIAVSNKANPVSAKGMSVAFEVIRLLGRVLERYGVVEPVVRSSLGQLFRAWGESSFRYVWGWPRALHLEFARYRPVSS